MPVSKKYILWCQRSDIAEPSVFEWMADLQAGAPEKGEWFHFDFTRWFHDADDSGRRKVIDGFNKECPDTAFKFEKPLEPRWRSRENRRIRQGIYNPLPQEWLDHLVLVEDHFAHLSDINPKFMFYTVDTHDGEYDTQTGISVKKYFRQFHSAVSEQTIETITNAIAENFAVKLTRDAQEFCDIYANGPDSCMKYRPQDQYWPWQKNDQQDVETIHPMPDHPVAAYCGGDLALAYTGHISAPRSRVLVWPDRRTFSAPYGQTNSLVHQLRNAGYSFAPKDADEGILSGARLKLIRHSEGKIVLPAIDIVSFISYCDGQLYLGDITQFPEFDDKDVFVFHNRHFEGIAEPNNEIPEIQRGNLEFFPL